MDVKIKLIVPLIISLTGCVTKTEYSPCIHMEGAYQRIDATRAIKDNRNITVYLKHINGTKNGFYGIIDYTDFKYSLQPMVKENPQCEVIFETEKLFYTKDSGKYGCNFVISDNADSSKFYCLRKTSDKTPAKINSSFDKMKNEPWFNDMSEVDSVVKWNESL